MTLKVGSVVRVRSLGRKPVEAVVVRDDDETVRVRFVTTGKARTVSRDRIVGERARPKSSSLTRQPKIGALPMRVPKASAGPMRDPAYLEFVRERPCAICSRPPPSDPHHFGPRGMGQKTDDYRVLPLCRRCHDEYHATGRVSPYATKSEVDAAFYRAQIDALLAYMRRIG